MQAMMISAFILGWVFGSRDFLNASDEKIILDKSYRLPTAEFNPCPTTLVKRLRQRQQKIWKPTERDGHVTWHRDILDVDLTNGEWLILARTNYIANMVARNLYDQGYLYWYQGRGWSISPNVLTGIEVWLRLCKGHYLSAKELKEFSKSLSSVRGYQSWQEKPRGVGPRANLHARRYTTESKSPDIQPEQVARSDQGQREGADLHYFCAADGRVYLIGQAEDPDIDDTQSQRWRGG
jgi:hypothetical protein